MIINSSQQTQEVKRVYQTPKLDKNTQWQPLIQALSVPAGPNTGFGAPPSPL